MKLNAALSFKLFITFLILNITASQPAYAQDKIYTFGVVPQFETKRLHNIWRPILSYLSKETGYLFEIQGIPSIPDFEKDLSQGKYDFAYMNPYHMVIANAAQNYTPLVRDEDNMLSGVLVVKKDSGIKTIAQLNEQKIAFPAPNALGASLQMRQELNDIFHIKIKPVYVKTHDSVYLNVVLGETLAGGGIQKTLDNQPIAYRHALKVIHTTIPVAPHPIASHPRVPEKVRDAVKSVFLKMGRSPEGYALLAKIPMNKTAPAHMDDYLPLKELKLERFYVK